MKVTWSSKDGFAGGRAAMLLRQCPALRELTLKLCHNSVVRDDRWSPYKIQLYGMRQLLKLRGLTDINIFIPTHPHCHVWPCPHIRRDDRFHGAVSVNRVWSRLVSPRDVGIMIERLQVTKQPRDEKELNWLAKIDGHKTEAKDKASAKR